MKYHSLVFWWDGMEVVTGEIRKSKGKVGDGQNKRKVVGIEIQGSIIFGLTWITIIVMLSNELKGRNHR